MAKSDQNGFIDWDNGREGYIETRSKFVPVVDVSKPGKRPKGEGNLLSIKAEERFGSLIAAGGMAWLVYVATTDLNHLWQMSFLPLGPVEVGAVGILLWLHAKWRRSIKN